MSGHTPGPWRYETDGFSSYLVGADGRIIAGGEPHEGYMDGETPDGRLIAAAPDLLSALTQFMEGVDDDCGDPLCGECAPFRAARRAIAKANGESA